MSGEEWIVIPNWGKFQHYQKRQPIWIKLYTELASDADWLGLTDAARGLLVLIWIEHARSRGVNSVASMSRLGHNRGRTRSFDSLIQAGFIQLSASKPLAHRYQDASPEKKKRRREPSKEGSLSDALARASSQAKPRASAQENKPGDYERGLNMTRNGGHNYDETAYQDELDRLELTPDERTTLEQLRNQLNTPVTSDPELW